LLFAERGKFGKEISKEFTSVGQKTTEEAGAEATVPEPPLMCTISFYYIGVNSKDVS